MGPSALDPLTFRRQFDAGAGPGPLQRASAAYNQFANHIQYLAERTQAIANQLEWESIAAEQAQQAAAAFYLSMQQFAQTSQQVAVVAQSSAGSYTQADQTQFPQEILDLILVAMLFYEATCNPLALNDTAKEWVVGIGLAFVALQFLTSSLGQSSSMPAPTAVSPIASGAAAPAASSGGDLGSLIAPLAAAIPAVAAGALPLLTANGGLGAPPPFPPPPGALPPPFGAGSLLAAPPGSPFIIPPLAFGPGAEPSPAPRFARAAPISGMAPPTAGSGNANSRKKNQNDEDEHDTESTVVAAGEAYQPLEDESIYAEYTKDKPTLQRWGLPA